MEIRSQRLKLRFVTADDLERVHALQSSAEVDRYNTAGIPENLDATRGQIADWIVGQQAVPSTRYTFCIELPDGTFLGLLGIVMGKSRYRNAEIWYKIFPEFWNSGYATEAVKSALNFGFTKLNLHRMEAGCAVENIASIRVLEKVGMTREAHRRKLLPIRGSWVDNYEFAILDSEYTGNTN